MTRERDEAGRYVPGPHRDVAMITRCTRADRKRWAAEARARGESLCAAVRRLLDGATPRKDSGNTKVIDSG